LSAWPGAAFDKVIATDRLRVTGRADFAGYDRSHSAKDFAHMLATIKALFPDGAD
jgi:D-amino-acid dehydrogenase